MKKDDHLLVNSTFSAQIRPETFLKVQPEPGPTYKFDLNNTAFPFPFWLSHTLVCLFYKLGHKYNK